MAGEKKKRRKQERKKERKKRVPPSPFSFFSFLPFFFCFFFFLSPNARRRRNGIRYPCFDFVFFLLHPFACYLRTRILHNLDETGLEEIVKRGRDKGKTGKRERAREGERDEAVKSKWQERGQEARWGANDLKNNGEKGRQKGLKIALHSGAFLRRAVARAGGKEKKTKKGRQRENRKETNGRKREKRVSWEEKGRIFA